MPDDITAISSDELGLLYGLFVAMCEYLDTATALAEIDSAEAEAYRLHVEAKERLRTSGTVQDKAAKTLNNEAYIEAEQESLVATGKAKLLRARLRGYDRCASALSREMTRRLEASAH